MEAKHTATQPQEPVSLEWLYVEGYAITPHGITKAQADGDLMPEEAAEWIEKLIRHNAARPAQVAPSVKECLTAEAQATRDAEWARKEAADSAMVREAATVWTAALETAAQICDEHINAEGESLAARIRALKVKPLAACNVDDYLIDALRRAKEVLRNADYQELTHDELVSLIDAAISKATGSQA